MSKRSILILSVAWGIVIALLFIPNQIAKADNCQPGQVCSFPMSTPGSDCRFNEDLFVSRADGWKIPAEATLYFNSSQGPFNKIGEYRDTGGTPGGCVCDVASWINNFLKVNGFETFADKPKHDSYDIAGVPSEYFVTIWHNETPKPSVDSWWGPMDLKIHNPKPTDKIIRMNTRDNFVDIWLEESKDIQTSCQFQPMVTDRTPTENNIINVAKGPSGNGNITWDETYVGLHRWNKNQWPGVDYLVNTTLPFKNGGKVYSVGWDNAGGGNSIMVDGIGPCEGWRVFYGHLSYNPTTIFQAGQEIGPDEIIGKPGCSGFICTETLPAHNHVTLGFNQNIFNFDDKTKVEFVAGYWWIHPTRVEGHSNVELKVNPETKQITEFVIDEGFTIDNSSNSAQNFFLFIKEIILNHPNIAFFVVIVVLILMITAFVYSKDFRRDTIICFFVIIIVGVLIYLLRANITSAFTPAVEPRQVSTFSVDLSQDEQKVSGWTTEVNSENGSNCTLSTAYSESVRRWCDIITRWSQIRGIDPNLVAALITQESGGDPIVISNSGAVGLTQVMPQDGIAATFKNSAGVPYFSDRPTIVQLQDPDFNVEYGTELLVGYGILENQREALKRYGPRPSDLLELYGSEYYYADKVLAIYQSYK